MTLCFYCQIIVVWQQMTWRHALGPQRVAVFPAQPGKHPAIIIPADCCIAVISVFRRGELLEAPVQLARVIFRISREHTAQSKNHHQRRKQRKNAACAPHMI